MLPGCSMTAVLCIIGYAQQCSRLVFLTLGGSRHAESSVTITFYGQLTNSDHDASPPIQSREYSDIRVCEKEEAAAGIKCDSIRLPGNRRSDSKKWEGAECARARVVPHSCIMRLAGPVRIIVVLLTVGLTWILAGIMLGTQNGFPRVQQILGGSDVITTADPRPRRYKCGLPQPCPEKHFAFRVVSGAANVIGPKICLEDKMLMSSVQNNVGRGLNIALVNGVNGELIEAKAFDMWDGDVAELMNFLRPIHEGTLVLLASYDDPATKMTEDARKMFSELGSSSSKDVAFRDSWVFVGAKGVQDKSPFEQLIKNSKSSNKYEGWPEAVELEGCVPQRTLDLE